MFIFFKCPIPLVEEYSQTRSFMANFLKNLSFLCNVPLLIPPQINMKVKQNAINLIFAVTAEQIGVYDRLKAHIEGSSSGMLTNDSSNVVELVKEQYDVSGFT